MRTGNVRVGLGVMFASFWLGCSVPVGLAFAQEPAASTAEASNRIERILATEQGGNIIVKLSMAQPLSRVPASFSMASPARIAFDFPDTANGLGRNSQTFNTGDLRSANIVQVGDRTRLVLNLDRKSVV